MGRNPWYWIRKRSFSANVERLTNGPILRPELSLVPVGGSFTNGLDFPRNPRFTEDGRWRRRAEWPLDV